MLENARRPRHQVECCDHQRGSDLISSPPVLLPRISLILRSARVGCRPLVAQPNYSGSSTHLGRGRTVCVSDITPITRTCRESLGSVMLKDDNLSTASGYVGTARGLYRDHGYCWRTQFCGYSTPTIFRASSCAGSITGTGSASTSRPSNTSVQPAMRTSAPREIRCVAAWQSSRWAVESVSPALIRARAAMTWR